MRAERSLRDEHRLKAMADLLGVPWVYAVRRTSRRDTEPVYEVAITAAKRVLVSGTVFSAPRWGYVGWSAIEAGGQQFFRDVWKTYTEDLRGYVRYYRREHEGAPRATVDDYIAWRLSLCDASGYAFARRQYEARRV